MSTEELEAAYLDAMQRLKGSVCGPQLAAPIEEYVNKLEGTIRQMAIDTLDGTLDAILGTIDEIIEKYDARKDG